MAEWIDKIVINTAKPEQRRRREGGGREEGQEEVDVDNEGKVWSRKYFGGTKKQVRFENN